MGNIQILDPHLANLVAAGEVVDRPASAIKEMLENAIDAGATMLTVEIKNGGSSFMRVTDNGCGMDRSDALACLSRHATSKLRQSSDLGAIMTLGFRGEALAAIASVSDFRILTRRKEDEMGTLVECREGKIERCESIGCPYGTTVIAEALFANIPARRKFLKKDLTETAAVVAVVEKLALSRPDISFALITDEKLRFTTEGDGRLYNTIYGALGRDFTKKLTPVDDLIEGIRIWGFVGRPDNVRGNRNQQNFFINGRYVKSATATAALEQAFHSYCPSDRFPCCVLHIEIHPALVDVNVHPAKLEVKFASEKAVFYAIYCAVRNGLSKHLTPPELQTPMRLTADDVRGVTDLSKFKAKTPEEALKIAREQEARLAGFVQINTFDAAASAEPSARDEQAPAKAPASEAPVKPSADQISPTGQASPDSPSAQLSPTSTPAKPMDACPEASPSEAVSPVSDPQEELTEVPLMKKRPRSKTGEMIQVGVGYRPADDRKDLSYDPYRDLLQQEQARIAGETTEAATPSPAEPLRTVDSLSWDEPVGGGAVALLAKLGENPPSADAIPASAPTAAPEKATPLDAPEAQVQPLPDYRIGGILFQCYVMVEIGNRLLLIDKHAAHERILYEQLRENMMRAQSFSQLLLLPLPLSPTAPELAAAMEFAPELHAIGFDFTQGADGNSLELTQIPSEIETSSASDAFLTLLGHLASGTSIAQISRQTLCEAALFQASCKAAVKAGREDDPGHIRWIVEQVLTRNDIRFCPHGRPVALEMTKSEVEHLFHRP